MLLVLLGLAQVPSDISALTEGVTSLSAPGALPGAMVASKGAFAVLAGDKPVAVAGRVGAGRAVAVGHESYFAASALKNGGNARFLLNSLRWLAGDPKPRVGTIDLPVIGSVVGDTVSVHRDALETELLGLNVLAMTQGALDNNPKAQRTVMEWVKAGHGLLIAGPAWGWSQLNPGKSLLRDHAGNQMLLPYGIGFSGETVEGEPRPTADPLFRTDAALAALRKGGLAAADTARAVGTVSRALALESKADGGLVKEIRDQAAKEGDAWPLTDQMPFRRLQATLDYQAWESMDPEKVKADPSAARFPGAVDAKAKRTTRTVAIDTRVTQWHGTGLYASPGEVVTVTVPAEAAGKGLSVRVGPHTDELWHLAKWDRFPAISRAWPLAGKETKVASPFGGTIFIDVPEGSRLDTISVTISGAVPAPRYVSGETTKAEWNRQLAEPGGPWVELQGRKVALSLPRSAVANLTDPEPLMAFWDETFERARELYAAPPRTRPERYAVDRQISAGYMHSGYPIMTFEDVAKTFADVEKLRGRGATWGFFHELGHNFQEGAWTFDGTGEVTNNLFSLYGSEKLNGITPAEYGAAHPAMAPEAQRKRLAAYLAKGANFEDWKSDPFLALTMYAQLREAFGWEPFTKTFATYRRDGLRPRNELEQHDTWMVQMSRATGRNLGPFFVAWGVPTSEAARKSVEGLPGWMPEEMAKP
jgi:hypothetical protein